MKKNCGGGLRERKKSQTRFAIERSALELVLEHGYDGMTVDDICAKAGISRMTFFNYFPSKLSAIIGRSIRYPSAEQVLEALDANPNDNYLDVVASIFSEVRVEPDQDVMTMRKSAFVKMPQLFAQGKREAMEMQTSVSQALTEYLPKHPERRLMPDSPLEREVFMAMHSVRLIMHIGAAMHLYDEMPTTPGEIRRILADFMSD